MEAQSRKPWTVISDDNLELIWHGEKHFLEIKTFTDTLTLSLYIIHIYMHFKQETGLYRKWNIYLMNFVFVA